VVAETTCDGKKKMYELLAESRPMHVLELPHKVDDADAFAHWRRELEKLKAVLEERYGTAITPERLRQAIAAMNRERRLRRRVAALMEADAPPLTGRQLFTVKSSIACIPEDLRHYELILERCAGRSGDPARREAVRVLMTGVPMATGAERVLHLIEEHGGLVVALESCSGLKPILQDVEEGAADPLEALARKYFDLPCSVMTRNDRRLEMLGELARRFRAHCLVDLVWQACLTYDVESARVRRFAEEELGLPYLRIETDYSPADTARIAVRVEALFETVKERGSF
jgi:benzoyl-CoA reductase/2-hydroxyglutaryl-CoA dehydratase subunit BcrC/BadD/HgdB